MRQNSVFGLKKENGYMKGIKVGIVGVCFSLLGIAFATSNALAYGCAAVGLALAVIGCFTKDR